MYDSAVQQQRQAVVLAAVLLPAIIYLIATSKVKK